MKGTLIKTDKGYILEGNNLPNPRRLSIKNCEAIELGYDLDELSENHEEEIYVRNENDYNELANFENRKRNFEEGFQKALEILGDKKFSEKDMIDILKECLNDPFTVYDYVENKLRSIQQNEWGVEVVMDRIPADLAPGGWDIFPKLDADGCLVLKRV